MQVFRAILAVGLVLQCACVDVKTDDYEVIEIKGEDYERMFEEGSSWLVMFYAPWCPACLDLKPQWAELAQKELKDGLKIAQIDVNKYAALSGQFLIFNLPSIYHIHNGECVQYLGLHDMKYISRWVENEEWRSGEPIPSWRSPNGSLARGIGSFFKMADKIRTLKQTMVASYGIPPWCVYLILVIITVSTGTFVGMLLVCFCECILLPRQQESDVDADDRKTAEDSEEERRDERRGKRTDGDKGKKDKSAPGKLGDKTAASASGVGGTDDGVRKRKPKAKQ